MQTHPYYTQFLNTVLDYVGEHIHEDLPLARLAAVAGFSPFHFHRMFRALTGETLNNHIVRRRLERAVALMQASRGTPVTRIALDCGFQSSSDFSRTFKKQFGISPGRWDRKTVLRESKIRQDGDVTPLYTEAELSAMQHEFTVNVKSLPALRFAYIRVQDSYREGRVLDAYHRLMAWLRRQRGAQGRLIGMSQDDPDTTPLHLCRYDIGMTVPEGVTGSGEVSVRVLPGCRVASLHVVGDLHQVDRAWQYLFRGWLPTSAYVPDNLPGMELYVKTPEEIGWETFDIEGVVPVIAL